MLLLTNYLTMLKDFDQYLLNEKYPLFALNLYKIILRDQFPFQ